MDKNQIGLNSAGYNTSAAEVQSRIPEMPEPVKWDGLLNIPRDGSWLLLDIEDGSTDDSLRSSVYVGRWNPKNFPDLGPHFYEWEVIVRYPDSQFSDGHVTTHYSEGRVSGWRLMPDERD